MEDEVSQEVQDVALDPEHPERIVQVGASLPDDVKSRIIQLLREYKDVFAWSPEDMTGVSTELVTHKLHIDPEVKPVKQKKRTFALERAEAINTEVRKLVAADILKEVYYPTWLANPVMIKKPDGGWRLCIDFTDLNKYCPKSCYPLPTIDIIVEAITGYAVLMFLDAYKGYHQILMDEEDAEKTAFITDIGVFCYKKMPFGLENAGATYQRLVNKVFEDLIGRNMEVYVDDMVIKSRTVTQAQGDLRETLEQLRRVNMKLNPAKCTFGVGSGKFLGFLVSRRGITANPKKGSSCY